MRSGPTEDKWTPFKTEACGSLSGFGNTSRLDAIVLEICRKELKRAELLPDIANNYGRKSGQKNLAWVKNKRGYRAEVRRERKKRDILSPVNVLHN